MKTIETYWTYEILCIDGEKPRSLVISPNDTLEKAVAGAFKDATYYIGVCGYRVAVAFEERCKACGGSGQIVRRTRRTCKVTVCKACKGKSVVRAFEAVEFAGA